MCPYRRSLQNSEIPEASPEQDSERPRYSDNPDRQLRPMPDRVFPRREVRLPQLSWQDLRLELVGPRFSPKRLGRGRGDQLHRHEGK